MEVRYISIGMFPHPVAAYVDYYKLVYPQSRYFCIHKSVGRGLSKRWTLTHIPSGYAMGRRFRTRAEAVKCLGAVLSMQKGWAHKGEDFSYDMRNAEWWLNESKMWYKSIVVQNGGN